MLPSGEGEADEGSAFRTLPQLIERCLPYHLTMKKTEGPEKVFVVSGRTLYHTMIRSSLRSFIFMGDVR